MQNNNGYLYSSRKRAFCLNDEIGFIKNGTFSSVEYDEKIFLEIVHKVIHSRKACTVESVLRKAILIYLNEKQVQRVECLAKTFRKNDITQSKFYQKWIVYITNSNEFKSAKIFAIIANLQRLKKIQKAHEAKRILDMHT